MNKKKNATRPTKPKISEDDLETAIEAVGLYRDIRTKLIALEDLCGNEDTERGNEFVREFLKTLIEKIKRPCSLEEEFQALGIE